MAIFCSVDKSEMPANLFFNTYFNPDKPECSEFRQFIVSLSEVDIDLYLTGSRLFGGVTEESDWDFFCGRLSSKQEAALQKLGFTVEFEVDPDTLSKDTQVLCDKTDKTKTLFGGTLRVFALSLKASNNHTEFHILEVDNVNFRLKTQRVIRHFFPDGYTDKKHNAIGIWNMAETVVALRASLGKMLQEVCTYRGNSPVDRDFADLYMDTNKPYRYLGGEEIDYDEENDWEDCFDWVMESYVATAIRGNLSAIHTNL